VFRSDILLCRVVNVTSSIIRTSQLGDLLDAGQFTNFRGLKT
jgi:hypothetical protein